MATGGATASAAAAAVARGQPDHSHPLGDSNLRALLHRRTNQSRQALHRFGPHFLRRRDESGRAWRSADQFKLQVDACRRHTQRGVALRRVAGEARLEPGLDVVPRVLIEIAHVSRHLKGDHDLGAADRLELGPAREGRRRHGAVAAVVVVHSHFAAAAAHLAAAIVAERRGARRRCRGRVERSEMPKRTLHTGLHLIKDYDDCIGVGEARLRHDWIVSIWAGSSAGIGCGAASSFCDHRRDI